MNQEPATSKKLIEALKELKLIGKRIEKANQEISQYASILSNERVPFGTEEDQKKHVRTLVQSVEDLITYATTLKMRIDYTNMNTIVEINGSKYTISQLIQIRQPKMGDYAGKAIQTYTALNTFYSDNRKHKFGNTSTEAGQIIVIPMYEENFKNRGLTKWMELRDLIDGKLEVVNATTELLNLPETLVQQL